MTDATPPHDEDLVRVLGEAIVHPVQGRILMVLAERGSRSAQEISAQLEEPADRIRYHLRQLRERGLIESSGEKARRGVMERFYRTLFDPFLSDEQFESLSRPKRVRAALEVFKAIFTDTSLALKSGVLADRAYHLTRVRLQVDAKGWNDLRAVYTAAFEDVERIKEEAEGRLNQPSAELFWVTSALLCFECPPHQP